MFAPENTVFVDRVELELVQPRDLAGPSLDHGLRETKTAEAGDLGCCNRPTAIRERRLVNRSGRQHRPCELPVERPAHGRMLLSSDLSRRVNNTPGDVVNQTQDAHSITDADFRRSLQGFEQMQRKKTMPESRA